MEVLSSLQPALLVLFAALLVPVLSRRLAHAVGVVSLLGVVVWAVLVPDGIGPTYTFMGFELILLSVDDFTRLMAIIFGGFGAAAVAYAYYADTDRRHLMWGLAYVGPSIWTVTVGDWLALLIGWEVMAIASTVFVWLSGGAAIRAGYRYAIAHGIGGSLLLGGVVLYLVSAGADPTALHFDGTGITGFETAIVGTTVSLAALLAGLGIGVNTAMVGLHTWLPDTYPRPNVATSVFLACYTTKSAVYAAYRAFPEGSVVLAFMGASMAIYGASYALAQKDMRRLLSYHIQSQVGFMLAGIGIGTSLGIAGGFAHLFNHILYKGLLFMAAGILILQLRKEKLNDFGAIGTSAPIALGLFLVGALSITGVPGFNGFISKGMVMDAADYQFVAPGALPADTLLWMLYVGSVGTFASFIKFGYYAFLDGEPIESTDANLGHALVGGVVAAGCIVYGVYYQGLFAILPEIGNVGMELDPYSTSHLLKAVGLAAGGLVVFAVLKRPVLDSLHGGTDVDRIYDPVAFFGTRSLSGGIGGLYNRVDDAVVRTGWSLVGTAHDPSRRIRALLPEHWRERYDQRVGRTPGKTGGKLGIGHTIYVATGVLMLALGLALFI